MWNLQSYPITVLNERMWHFRGSKHSHLQTPPTYFQGVRTRQVHRIWLQWPPVLPVRLREVFCRAPLRVFRSLLHIVQSRRLSRRRQVLATCHSADTRWHNRTVQIEERTQSYGSRGEKSGRVSSSGVWTCATAGPPASSTATAAMECSSV